MKKLNYVIVMVSDMKRSVEFYREILGLPLKFESPHWSEFANDGSTIALHPGGPPQAGAAPGGKQPSGSCGLGFQVEDLEAFNQQMEAKGVRCLQPPKKEDFGGRLAVYADPDGLSISVAESQKN